MFNANIKRLTIGREIFIIEFYEFSDWADSDRYCQR